MTGAGPGVADRDAPIGVFDSGVGGLTVLRAIHRTLPAEATVYLGDTARVPYGPKSPETVRRYASEAAAFLMDRGIKALVIACNTATAHAAEALAADSPIPVIGVVDPGARAAAETSPGGAIGVIGTRGTIGSGTYERAILRFRPEARVRSVACPLFVALAEEGWLSGPIATLTAREYLDPLLAEGIDTLVLGCTHYPLLRPLLADVVGPDVRLVDSADATAAETARRLGDEGLLATREGEGEHTYFVTDAGGGFGEIAERFLGRAPRRLERATLGDEPGV